MDKQTMRLRAIIQGKWIEFHDIYYGHCERFVVTDVERENSGTVIIKGETAFQKVYVPGLVIDELIKRGSCSFRKQYDTSVLKYNIRICEKEQQ